MNVDNAVDNNVDIINVKPANYDDDINRMFDYEGIDKNCENNNENDKMLNPLSTSFILEKEDKILSREKSVYNNEQHVQKENSIKSENNDNNKLTLTLNDFISEINIEENDNIKKNNNKVSGIENINTLNSHFQGGSQYDLLLSNIKKNMPENDTKEEINNTIDNNNIIPINIDTEIEDNNITIKLINDENTKEINKEVRNELYEPSPKSITNKIPHVETNEEKQDNVENNNANNFIRKASSKSIKNISNKEFDISSLISDRLKESGIGTSELVNIPKEARKGRNKGSNKNIIPSDKTNLPTITEQPNNIINNNVEIIEKRMTRKDKQKEPQPIEVTKEMPILTKRKRNRDKIVEDEKSEESDQVSLELTVTKKHSNIKTENKSKVANNNNNITANKKKEKEKVDLLKIALSESSIVTDNKINNKLNKINCEIIDDNELQFDVLIANKLSKKTKILLAINEVLYYIFNNYYRKFQ
jgi:hypothetical protein